MTLDELKRLIAEATKSPWRIGPDEEGAPAQCLSAGGWDIATLWGGYLAAEANARLIAAAPDLAAQVVKLTEALARIDALEGQSMPLDPFLEAKAIARAALKLLEGK